MRFRCPSQSQSDVSDATVRTNTTNLRPTEGGASSQPRGEKAGDSSKGKGKYHARHKNKTSGRVRSGAVRPSKKELAQSRARRMRIKANNQGLVYIGNIPPETTEEDLRSLFSPCGAIIGIVIRCAITATTEEFAPAPATYYATVDFSGMASVLAALGLNGAPLRGRNLIVVEDLASLPEVSEIVKRRNIARGKFPECTRRINSLRREATLILPDEPESFEPASDDHHHGSPSDKVRESLTMPGRRRKNRIVDASFPLTIC
ncbi:hypothetical protein BD410DRAFT_779719 [Rickenella mellea]|uniref:RRM domain-containing protein n=1 Tax=Rickenella mellea TaxID=50990 RepID=A0A4R5XEA2_9AGAM|nr:hypothetical protein BD410DRAFT_779719 [Rickenella mellea]